MFMYKIISITDLHGNPKHQELFDRHPTMMGKLICCQFFEPRGIMMFEWADDSNNMLKTSIIYSITYELDNIIVKT